MPSNIWYRDYENLRVRVANLGDRFEARCKELELDKKRILEEFSREFIARAVHESNWQEGLELDRGKTQILANIAFDELEEIEGPHLDMTSLLQFHRSSVKKMLEEGSSIEEIGAYNLARAYHAIGLVGSELANRQSASLAHVLKSITTVLDELQEQLPTDVLKKLKKAIALVDELENDRAPVHAPLNLPYETQGDILKELLKLDSDHLIYPMRRAYIHFFHKIVLTGIYPLEKGGKYRKTPVHVGNSDLQFPPPSAISQLMREFCKKFPAILPGIVKYDPILIAAKASHGFVAIHPYEDGNGRVSRLIMNLILWGNFPPVYLKSDGKGRRRYGQALRRADRGDIKPLASLIALSLIEIYEKILKSLGISEKMP